MRITLGNQLHESYIHEVDSDLIEHLVNLQTNDITNMKKKRDCVQYRVSPTDVFPRYTEGEKVEYLFEVSTEGHVTNIANIITSKPRVVNIETPRKKTDFDRVTIEQLHRIHNSFNLQRTKGGLDQMYIKSNIRCYNFEYNTYQWTIEFNELYGNPYKYLDNVDILYFTDKPKSQCIIYGPYDVPLSTVKGLLQVVIPSIYKVKK